MQNFANSALQVYLIFSLARYLICPPMRVATVSRWSQYHGVRTWPFVCPPSQQFTLLSLYPHTDRSVPFCPWYYISFKAISFSQVFLRTQHVRLGKLVGKVSVAQPEYCFCKVEPEKLFLC